jgi:3-phytase
MLILKPRGVATAAIGVLFLTASMAPAIAADGGRTVRFATFNASLNRNAPGRALQDLSSPGNAQASAVAEIIQRTRPDILLINEFDYEPNGALAKAFLKNYLNVSQHGARKIDYRYWFVAPSNTGIHSGYDFDNNGVVNPTPNVPPGTNPSYGNDSYGFGDFPGQFGLAVFSRFPILGSQVRTFQYFLWKDMPGARLPDDSTTPAPADWYSPVELAVFRLSSKSHWDVPIQIGGQTIHFLVSHPTPPVFDGAEDRNGLRNADEIRFWADYVSGGSTAGYVYDDHGQRGGLASGAQFVIAGDENSDPVDGDSVPGAIQQLLDLPVVNTSVTPESAGGTYWGDVQDALNDTHEGDPKYDTADFCDTATPPPCSGPGNLRADYVLPRVDLPIQRSGIFWPVPPDPLVRLTGTGFPVPSSDHRLVWVAVRLDTD